MRAGFCTCQCSEGWMELTRMWFRMRFLLRQLLPPQLWCCLCCCCSWLDQLGRPPEHPLQSWNRSWPSLAFWEEPTRKLLSSCWSIRDHSGSNQRHCPLSSCSFPYSLSADYEGSCSQDSGEISGCNSIAKTGRTPREIQHQAHWPWKRDTTIERLMIERTLIARLKIECRWLPLTHSLYRRGNCMFLKNIGKIFFWVPKSKNC